MVSLLHYTLVSCFVWRYCWFVPTQEVQDWSEQGQGSSNSVLPSWGQGDARALWAQQNQALLLHSWSLFHHELALPMTRQSWGSDLTHSQKQELRCLVEEPLLLRNERASRIRWSCGCSQPGNNRKNTTTWQGGGDIAPSTIKNNSSSDSSMHKR